MRAAARLIPQTPTIIRAIMVLIALVCPLGCEKGDDPKIEPVGEWMTPYKGLWTVQSPGKSYSVAAASDVRKDGQPSLRFELRAGEQYVNPDDSSSRTYRAEVHTRQRAAIGSERWYAFSVYLPEDFPIEDNRLVLAQWYQKDTTGKGDRSRSPALAMRYVGGRLGITLRHSAETVVADAEKVPTENLFKSPSPPAAGAFLLGQWNDFVVQAKWSPGSEGMVNVWWNGRRVVQYQGPVGYQDSEGPYFKFGLYRDQTDKTYVAYFNQVRYGEGARDVGFDPAPPSGSKPADSK